MIRDNKGQISIEYLLIFAVSLILLIVFTLPLLQFGLENTMDVSQSLNAKSELSKLSNAISQVYAEGQGSKQTVYLTFDSELNLKISPSYISAVVKMSDGKNREIKVFYNSNFNSGSLFLEKGENKIIVEWPVDSEKMTIYKKY